MFSLKRELYIMRRGFQRQPLWQKIGKYVVLFGVMYLLRHSPYFWFIFACILLLALAFHFFVRYKSKGWTKDYGKFKADDYKQKAFCGFSIYGFCTGIILIQAAYITLPKNASIKVEASFSIFISPPKTSYNIYNHNRLIIKQVICLL